jgi:Raf kinase inhibitor-like YbhB/YbcL family protein
MKISSPAFNDGERVPVKYTCEGPNISPPLTFTDVPSNAKSLVLMVEDPDAPAKPWVHWLVFNIPPTAKGFDESSIAQGSVQGLCNGNTFGYEGPCPPQNEHTYLFKLYALDKKLDIPNESDRKTVLREMEGHVIAEAVLRGKYKKEKIAQTQPGA